MPHGPISIYQLIYQAHTEPVFVPASAVNVDSWFVSFSDNLKLKAAVNLLAVQRSQSLALDPAVFVPSIDNQITLTQRRLQGLPVAEHQFLAYAPFTPAAATVNEDSWHQAWVDPVRLKSGLPASGQQFLAINYAVIVPWIDTQWFSDLSRLRTTASLLAIHRAQSLALDPAVFVPSIDNQITLTQRRLQGLPVADHQALAFTQVVTTATVSVDSWGSQLSIPVKVSWTTGAVSSPFAGIQTPVPDDGWHTPWVDPPKSKAGLPTAEQSYLAYAPFTPAAAQVNEDSWHQPWRDPVRLKPGLAASQQQAFAFATFTPPQTVASWGSPLPDPIQLRAPWKTGDTSYAFGAVSATTTIPTIDGWGSPLFEVPKAKTGLRTANQQFLAFDTAVFPASVDGWWRPFVEVPKPKSGLAINNQQFLAFTESAPFTETVSEDRWHQPWSEPVRTKPGLAPSQQLATAYSPFVAAAAAPSADGWVNPFGVVPKGKAGLSTANQQFQAFVEAAPFTETVTEDRWHQPWSEPVRYRVDPRRAVALNNSSFQSFNPRQPDVSFGYYRALSDPVRFRRFETAYQVALARNTFVPTPVAGAVLDVTETGDVFNGTLYAFNAPVACYVSIIQNNPHHGGNAGIIEN